MAYAKQYPVLLGFEDGLVTEKNKHLVNFKTNKIGGKPNFPEKFNGNKAPDCPLCQLPRLLVVQIYAPLENSPFHRIFYLFACINAHCWNNKSSWICQRIQVLDSKELCGKSETNERNDTNATSLWCQGSNDWEDATNFDMENGNIKIDNAAMAVSDEDESSTSFTDDIALENLTLKDKHNANDQLAAFEGGAIGNQQIAVATAEIEGAEGEAVSIDSPILPQKNSISLLFEKPKRNFSANADACFTSYFVSVYEEEESGSYEESQHIRELLQEYKLHCGGEIEVAATSGGGDTENYEKSIPSHGDKIFHHFLTKLQSNPGQLLRYQRDGQPLLMHHLQREEVPKICEHCKGDLTFEFQILSTLIPKLRLIGEDSDGTCLEFGTVMVYTCSKSCWTDDSSIRTEQIILQLELQ